MITVTARWWLCGLALLLAPAGCVFDAAGLLAESDLSNDLSGDRSVDRTTTTDALLEAGAPDASDGPAPPDQAVDLGCLSGATQSCYTGPTGTAGVGLCRAGKQSCLGGAWALCTGEVLPAVESCDNLDNDFQ